MFSLRNSKDKIWYFKERHICHENISVKTHSNKQITLKTSLNPFWGLSLLIAPKTSFFKLAFLIRILNKLTPVEPLSYVYLWCVCHLHN